MAPATHLPGLAGFRHSVRQQLPRRHCDSRFCHLPALPFTVSASTLRLQGELRQPQACPAPSQAHSRREGPPLPLQLAWKSQSAMPARPSLVLDLSLTSLALSPRPAQGQGEGGGGLRVREGRPGCGTARRLQTPPGCKGPTWNSTEMFSSCTHWVSTHDSMCNRVTHLNTEEHWPMTGFVCFFC